MALRTAFLLLALLGAVIGMQGVVHADDSSTSVAGASVEKSLDEQRNTVESEVDSFDVGAEDVESSGAVVADVDTEEQAEDDLPPGHSMARILHERSSKRCWSKKHCKKHFKKPGCCSKKCVNLASDNKNCGKCRRRCNTRKGYHCRSGKCCKVKKSSRQPQCSKKKKCKKGLCCCHPGKCVNLKTNSGHCGRCNKRCGHGRVCCKGRCTYIKHDRRNCGKCGNVCKFGKKCCHGYCKNVLGNDEHHCGACGKKCHTKCRFGMCDYGH